MNRIFRHKLIILVLLLSPFAQQINAQDEPIFDFTDSLTGYDSELIQALPFATVKDIFQFNPSVYRPDKYGNYYTNGFLTSDDYTIFDGVQLRFMEEMPLRLIGSVAFDEFDRYLEFGNSLTGFADFKPITPSDSFSFRVESSSTIIHKQTNNGDIQLLLSGPIGSGSKNGGTGLKISYSLASRLFSSLDYDPSYIARDQAEAGYLDNLENEPLRRATGYFGTYANALFTEGDNAVSSYFNSNAAKLGFSIYGNIEADFANGMSLKLGSYTVSKNETVPIYENYFFNQDHNPEKSTLYSGNYLRFEQQVNTGGSVRFHYQLQGQYSYYHSVLQDPNFGKDFFSYGYAGKFDTYKSPTFEYGSDTLNGNYYDEVLILNSWDYDTLVEFTPGDLNPGLAAYTSSYYSIFDGDPTGHYQNLDYVQLGGGLLNGQQPDMVYGLYNNTGTAYNEYSVKDERQVKIFASGDLVIGKHKISLGFQFTRDCYSAYHIHPVGLWRLMRGMTNFHISEIDIDHPDLHEGDLMDTIYYPRKYDALSQRAFDKNLREALGLDPEGLDFIDIDSYDYSTNSINYFDKDGVKHTVDCGQELFSLDMFTADELLNDGNSFVAYNGYDYLGNRVKNKVTFEDFFTDKNSQGEYLRQTGAYIPMNYSAYTDYQVNLKGWYINAGFRIDAFDANQQVLKDPFLLYESYTAGDLDDIQGFSVEPPSGIGDDFVVYVDNTSNPTRVMGYRNGDQWYDDSGNPISDANELDAGSGVSPYLIYPELENITIDVFTRNKIWFNFLPQVSIQKKLKNWLLLSFRYNSAVQNPAPEITFSNPATYYYFNNLSTWISNGSLKPERTDRLRAGLSVMPLPGFVITAEGFADRFNNMIYPIRRVGAYPKDYTSFANFDDPFFQYGTDLAISHSSGKSSGFNYALTYHLLINKDNPAYHLYDYLVPKNLLKGYLQFNTGYGNDYMGPSGSVNYSIFESLGISLFSQFQSGVYYLKAKSPDNPLYNQYTYSATMPAQVYFDLKIEKGIHFNNERYRLNFYCTIQNLFNTKIIYKVYHFTGDPDDNGYLTHPKSQKQISEALSEASYRYLYANYINDPNNYGLPRRTTMGISFSF